MNLFQRIGLVIFLIGLAGYYHQSNETLQWIFLVSEMLGMSMFIYEHKND